MENNTVSVIMSVYNEREEWLRQSIESILSQTYPHLEFILVLDNPSNAALERILREYAARDARIVFLKNEENLGLVRSLNRALEAASGAYIARMDADDISEPERIETELRALRENDLDLVSVRIRRMNEEGAVYSVDPNCAKTPEITRYALRYRSVLAHPSWLARADAYARVGPYHSIPHAEDYEWLCRAASMGMRMACLEPALLRYRVHGGSISQGNTGRQKLIAAAVRREYRRALRTGGGMREDALLRAIGQIGARPGSKRFEKSAVYRRDGWAMLREGKRLAGAYKVFLSFALYPARLKATWEDLWLRIVNACVRQEVIS